MDWQEFCSAKIVDEHQAISKIMRGSRVFIGTGCGEPQHLIRAMVKDQNLQDIMIYQMLSFTLSQFVEDESFTRRFSLKLFFISQVVRSTVLVSGCSELSTLNSRALAIFRFSNP